MICSHPRYCIFPFLCLSIPMKWIINKYFDSNHWFKSIAYFMKFISHAIDRKIKYGIDYIIYYIYVYIFFNGHFPLKYDCAIFRVSQSAPWYWNNGEIRIISWNNIFTYLKKQNVCIFKMWNYFIEVGILTLNNILCTLI